MQINKVDVILIQDWQLEFILHRLYLRNILNCETVYIQH